MRFEQFANEVAVAAAAADLLEETVGARKDARVILPAGRTPMLFFAQIVERVRARRFDLSKARFFQLDEYVGCSPKDPRSFHAFLRAKLLDPLKRAPQHDCLINGAAKDPRAEIERHAARLAELGGANVAFLGIGTKGQVAFNEPGSTLDHRARMVELARETRAAVAAEFGRGTAPTRGITLGLSELFDSRRLALLATGANKSAILEALFDEPPSAQRPASLLLAHPNFVVFADVAAAAQLHTPPGSITASPRRQRAELRRGAAHRG